MRPLPRDPFALHARMIDALIGDILDPEATTFPRLDALREVSKQSTRESVRANNQSGGSLSGSHASHGALRSPPIGFDPGYEEGSDQ